MGFTEEQQAAIDLAAKGTSFALVAPAGSGKSTTALGMATAMSDKRILYLVYNTSAREEAEEKFRHLGYVDVRTTSQLAFRAYREHGNYARRMNVRAPHVPARDVAKALKLQTVDFGGGLELDGYTQAVHAARVIERFCHSDRERITERDVYLPVVGIGHEHIGAARKYLAALAQRIWDLSIMPNSRLRFTMAHAFKMLANGGRDYQYDAVLLDEAQDSNDATMRFLRNQKNSQIVLLGDPAQTLYGWRGASDQILKFDGPRLHLTKSFRFGPNVAAEAMKHLPHTRTGVTIEGSPDIRDEVVDGVLDAPDVVLTRTNAGAMEYAMSYLMAGKRVAMVKGTKQILSLAYAARDLMKGKRPTDPELGAFRNWSELTAYTEEPGGGHLKAIVKLINAYRVDPLISACKKMVEYNPRNPRYDVAVSTCHSIKGLEWKRVQIGDDFFPPEDPEEPEDGPGRIRRDEAMIHYVAVTRAQRTLARGGLAWIDDYPAPKELDLT